MVGVFCLCGVFVVRTQEVGNFSIKEDLAVLQETCGAAGSGSFGH